HPFWSAFEQFFETPSDENESAEAQNTVSDIKIDKHLYARNNRTYKAILKLIKGPKQEYNYKLATAWSEIPKPPPRNLLLIFYKI
ncbi:MAG: hypothetical protein JXR22_12475, partial [Prolixibacteraceae bacterium]|nr:hypothetical protein [Prolixibacteraceae bacterium]